jgi:hypothetical protein
MVIDAQILVTVKEKDVAAAVAKKESLYPERHNLTLPLNGLNCLFEKCTASFNQTTELTSDKYVYFYFHTILKNDDNA